MPPELGGPGSSIAMLGYDSGKGEYTEERLDSSGRHVVPAGLLNGDPWTWTGQNNYGGMTIQNRRTIKMISPGSYTMKYEVSADGGSTWLPFFNGKATKK